MTRLTSLLVLFLACFVVLSWANPLKDLAKTTIDVTETQTSPTTERFAVRVQRIDNIIDDDGSLVAAKAVSVIINFDVRDNEVRLNNVPVRLGASSIQIVQVEVIAADTDEAVANAIADTLSTTLATVEVASTIESFATDKPDVTLRRVTIRIRVVELDGAKVVQTDAVERILELKVATPALHDLSSPTRGSLLGSNHVHHHHKGCFKNLRNRIRHWWYCSSRFVRVAITSSVLAVFFGLLFVAIPAAYRRFRRAPYEPVALTDEPQQKVDQIIYVADDEKRALMEQQEDVAEESK